MHFPHRRFITANTPQGRVTRSLIAVALAAVVILPAVSLSAVSPASANAWQTPALKGVIRGQAQTSTGKTLPNSIVQLRNINTGGLAGTTVSDATGAFSFSGLPPGTYVVELVNATGGVVGSGAAIVVGDAVVPAVTVQLTTAAATGAVAAGGASTALVVTAVAVAAGIPGVIVLLEDDPSPAR